MLSGLNGANYTAEEGPTWPWNSDLPEHHNVPGINVSYCPTVAFGMGSTLGSANTAFDLPNPFDPQASSFLEQLASDQLPESTPAVYEPVDFTPASAPASPLLRSVARLIAPLPRSRVVTTAPSTPRASSSHLAPVSHSSTPTTAQAPTQLGHSPGLSFPLLSGDRAHVFTWSCLALFETPVRQSSLCSSNDALSRPGTPASPGPNSGAFEPPHSPSPNESSFEADEAIAPLSGEREDSHAEVPAPDLTANEPSTPLHMSKRIRLIQPASHAPTLKEIHHFKTREYAAICKKRKNGPPSKTDKPPRVGAPMGLFSEEHQEYMFVFRSSLTADVVMISPWLVPEADMVERAIVRSDAATGLRREDVVQGKFEATVDLLVQPDHTLY